MYLLSDIPKTGLKVIQDLIKTVFLSRTTLSKTSDHKGSKDIGLNLMDLFLNLF